MIKLTRTDKGIIIPLAFSLVCVGVFALVYRLIGVAKHFDLADDVKAKPTFASFYISIMAQSNAMGDATPKTALGRVLFATQVALGWAWIMVMGAVVANARPK